jgi:hypothetical protein
MVFFNTDAEWVSDLFVRRKDAVYNSFVVGGQPGEATRPGVRNRPIRTTSKKGDALWLPLSMVSVGAEVSDPGV